MSMCSHLRSRRARMSWGWCCRRWWPETEVCCTRFVGRCACNPTAVRPAGECAVLSAYCCRRTRPHAARRGPGGSPAGSKLCRVILFCLCFRLRGRSFKGKNKRQKPTLKIRCTNNVHCVKNSEELASNTELYVKCRRPFFVKRTPIVCFTYN